jgi:hypothetical protein
VKSAWLDHVALVTTPANPKALVNLRTRGLTTPCFHTLMQRRIQYLVKWIDTIKTTHATAPANGTSTSNMVKPRQRQTDFARLVEAINSGVNT